jgi:hypothetical protein
LWFRGFGISGFHITNHSTQQLLNFEKWMDVGPPLRDFGFRGFKYQTTIHNNSRITKSERMWDHHFGILGFRGSKYQTTIHNNSRILKSERMWDHHFGILGFGISGFQITNQNIQQFLNFQKVKGCGTNISWFWVSGFQGFKCQTTVYDNSRIPKE